MEPIAVSVEKAAEYSSLSRDKIYRMMNAGELRYNIVGGRRVIDFAHLKEVVLGSRAA